MKSFWYEQAPLLKAQNIDRIYKFDQQRIVSEEWRPLNNRAQRHYRSIREYFQFVFPEDQMSDSDYAEVLAAIESVGPLVTDDELEILILPGRTGFEMTSHWIFLGEGAKFNTFTPEQWNDAYSKLRELEKSE